ncbi:MAG: class I tRNA ligase family protein, partial [Syntrophomonas sp.]|nr:class I tRNA ligase family protein [Syntrophomonas sp.]
TLYQYRDQEEQDLHVLREAINTLIILLSPFAPHICEEMWHICGHADSICMQSWPQWDEAALLQDEVEIAIQVSGKVRDRLTVPTGISRENLEKMALAQPKIQELINGKRIIKIIVVPGKLVNIVIQ